MVPRAIGQRPGMAARRAPTAATIDAARWVLGTRPRMTPVLMPPASALSPEGAGERAGAALEPPRFHPDPKDSNRNPPSQVAAGNAIGQTRKSHPRAALSLVLSTEFRSSEPDDRTGHDRVEFFDASTDRAGRRTSGAGAHARIEVPVGQVEVHGGRRDLLVDAKAPEGRRRPSEATRDHPGSWAGPNWPQEVAPATPTEPELRRPAPTS